MHKLDDYCLFGRIAERKLQHLYSLRGTGSLWAGLIDEGSGDRQSVNSVSTTGLALAALVALFEGKRFGW